MTDLGAMLRRGRRLWGMAFGTLGSDRADIGSSPVCRACGGCEECSYCDGAGSFSGGLLCSVCLGTGRCTYCLGPDETVGGADA